MLVIGAKLVAMASLGRMFPTIAEVIVRPRLPVQHSAETPCDGWEGGLPTTLCRISAREFAGSVEPLVKQLASGKPTSTMTESGMMLI